MIRIVRWDKWQGRAVRELTRRRLDKKRKVVLSYLVIASEWDDRFLEFAGLVGPKADAYMVRLLQYAARVAAESGRIHVTREKFGALVLSCRHDLVGRKVGEAVYDALLSSGLAAVDEPDPHAIRAEESAPSAQQSPREPSGNCREVARQDLDLEVEKDSPPTPPRGDGNGGGGASPPEPQAKTTAQAQAPATTPARPRPLLPSERAAIEQQAEANRIAAARRSREAEAAATRFRDKVAMLRTLPPERLDAWFSDKTAKARDDAGALAHLKALREACEAGKVGTP